MLQKATTGSAFYGLFVVGALFAFSFLLRSLFRFGGPWITLLRVREFSAVYPFGVLERYLQVVSPLHLASLLAESIPVQRYNHI
jgi:hypothetical protein